MATTTHKPGGFDRDRAGALVGKHVLVRMTLNDYEHSEICERRVHGVIVSADEHEGFGVELQGEASGKVLRLPPDMRHFREATAGEYRVRESGEVVSDPDLIYDLSITQPFPHEGE